MARILITDDDESYRRVVRVALTVRGHEVKEASNGFEAVEQMKRDPADLVLLDWQMPGMGGEEASRALREISDAPIILVSAADRSDEAKALGLDGALRKPVDFGVLVGMIEATLAPGGERAR